MPNSGSRSRKVSVELMAGASQPATFCPLCCFIVSMLSRMICRISSSRHAVNEPGVVDAVTEELPFQAHALFDDIGHVVAHGCIERDARAYVKLREGLHDAPDAGAIAVIAKRVVQDIRIWARPDRASLSVRRVQFVDLDVRGDPECNARAVWPADRWPIDQRQVCVAAGVPHHRWVQFRCSEMRQ